MNNYYLPRFILAKLKALFNNKVPIESKRLAQMIKRWSSRIYESKKDFLTQMFIFYLPQIQSEKIRDVVKECFNEWEEINKLIETNFHGVKLAMKSRGYNIVKDSRAN